MIREFFTKYNLEIKNKKFLLAASGGPDSMALLQMLIDEIPVELVVIAHLNHQLRKDSYLESKLLEKFCRKNNILFFDEKWPVNLHPQTGIEAAAREYRYQFLANIAEKVNADYLLTAHHGDDLLENILLKLIRSGDASEMSSLRPVRPWQGRLLVRPLLTLSKAQLLEFDKKRNISYIKDSTNDEDDVQRNRLRHHVIPFLKEENPNILTNGMRFLDSMSVLQQDREEYFSQIKSEIFMGCIRVIAKDIENMPLKVKSDYFSYLVLKNWHQQVNFEGVFKQNSRVANRNGFEINYYQGYYYLHQVKDFLKNNTKLKKVVLNKSFKWQNSNYIISNKKLVDSNYQEIGSFYTTSLREVTVGGLHSGIKLQLANGQWTKPKKKFAENAIPLFLRPACLTVYTSDEVVFVENAYQKQQYNKKFFKYWVYKLKV